MISRRTLLSMLPPLAAMPLFTGWKQLTPDITHPFSTDSAWNKPIDPARIVYTEPARIENRQFRDRAMANTWVQQADGQVATTLPDSPVKLFRYSTLNNLGVFSTSGEISLPTPIILPAPASEWSLWTDLDGLHSWEAWDVERLPDGTFHVSYLCHVNLKGTGWGDPVTMAGVGIRAAGCSVLGGRGTPAEVAALLIEHALPIELDITQLKAGTIQADQFVPPAVSADGGSVSAYSGTVPMGAHFALPPALALPTTLTPVGLALAKAYQKYGGYVVDGAGHTCSLALVTGINDAQVANFYTDVFWIRDNLVMTLPRLNHEKRNRAGR